MSGLLKNRYKKIQPVLRKRRLELDQQHLRVIRVRGLLEDGINELTQAQQAYMSIVEELNSERGSVSRGKLEILERGADRARTLWYQAFEQVKHRERLLAQEIGMLREAESSFKGVEKISSNISETIRADLEKAEQKVQDERSVLRFGQASEMNKRGFTAKNNKLRLDESMEGPHKKENP